MEPPRLEEINEGRFSLRAGVKRLLNECKEVGTASLLLSEDEEDGLKMTFQEAWERAIGSDGKGSKVLINGDNLGIQFRFISNEFSLPPEDDCNDADAAYHPGAPEGDCSDPGDYNCDGSSGFVDADADGFAACEECDDTDATVSPAETEICNDRDDDCNGTTDDAAVDASTWYADADSDGYTNPDVAVVECDAPAGYAAATDDDCDDADSASFPGAADTPDDGVDQDCSGADATDTGDTGPADDTGADDTSADDTGADDTSSDDTAIDDRATDDTGTGKDPGCGCATAGDVGPAGALLLLGAALAARRRRA